MPSSLKKIPELTPDFNISPKRNSKLLPWQEDKSIGPENIVNEFQNEDVLSNEGRMIQEQQNQIEGIRKQINSMNNLSTNSCLCIDQVETINMVVRQLNMEKKRRMSDDKSNFEHSTVLHQNMLTFIEDQQHQLKELFRRMDELGDVESNKAMKLLLQEQQQVIAEKTQEIEMLRQQAENLRMNITQPELRMNLPAKIAEKFLQLSKDDTLIARKILSELQKPPEKVGKKPAKLFEKTKNRYFELIFENYPIVEKCTALFDGTSEFAQWTDEEGIQCSGMRNFEHQEHGILIKVFPDGALMICSCKLGQSHGLSVEFEHGLVGVYLYDMGDEVASFSFNEKFQELTGNEKRRGNLLDHLSPADFDPAVDELDE